jgi:hypothetical protein
MRFDLRSLMILMAVGPPLATVPWWISDPKWNLHEASGALSILTYSLAVLGLAGVYWHTRDWRRPPRKTPLLWAAMGASIVSAGAGLAFFTTLPPPPSMTDNEKAAQYARERMELMERFDIP